MQVAVSSIASLYGRASFQASIIRLSYRTRGKEQRTHTNNTHKDRVLRARLVPPIKNIAVIKLRNKIVPYSLIKMRANRPPPYSMLNPETISDSPSAMSKGVRLVSAMHRRSQLKSRGKKKIISQPPDCVSFMAVVE